jgi:hypothetical protein
MKIDCHKQVILLAQVRQRRFAIARALTHLQQSDDIFAVKLKFNSHIYKKLQYQIVIVADLSFGTTFSGIDRTEGAMATPAAWSAFPAIPGSAVLR